jgi:hypothetical protein
MAPADKVRPDVHVVDEAEPVATPDAFGLCGIGVEAPVSLEAAEDGQAGVVGEVPERGIQPAGLARDEVVVLDKADDVRAGEPDRPVEDPDLMEVVGVDQEVVRPIQVGHPLLVRAIQ